jgi:hypothetical protein
VNNVSPITHLVMVAWIPLVQVLFMLMPARRAVIGAYLGAWLFLPVVQYPLPMLPDFTKMFATSLGVMLAVCMFDPGRFKGLRVRLYDAPMVAWCIAPFFSSVTNGLGAYDGASAVLDQVINWGLPYLVGRLYFTDLRSLRDLAVGVVIGGLIYVPLCLLEDRLSPQLHRWVYGYHAHSFLQTKRFWGWRPTVFMQHGLMVATWMMASALVAGWLWRQQVVKRVWGVPMLWACLALGVGVIIVKSVNAWFEFSLGVACLASIKWMRTPLLVGCIVIGVPGYMALRTVGGWDGSQLVAAAEATVGHERAASLQTRLSNEDILAEKALQKPLFGWGRWGRNRVYDENGNDISITDGLWVLALGQAGLLGLASLTGVFLAPALNVRRVGGKRGWRDPVFAAPIVLALLLVLYMMDNLLNAMVNPIFTLIAGGLTGLRRPRMARAEAREPVVEDEAADGRRGAVEHESEERTEQAA